MKHFGMRLLSFVFLISIVYSRSYSQDMTVPQTIDYINTKFANNSIEMIDGMMSSINIKHQYSVEVKTDGQIKLTESITYTLEKEGVFGKITIDRSFLPNDVKSTQSYNAMLEKKYYSGIYISCVGYTACMVNKATKTVFDKDWDGWMGLQLKWCDEKLSQTAFTVYVANRSDAQSLGNAFQYLCEKVKNDNAIRPQVNDPFAKKIQVDNNLENEVSTNNNSNTIPMVKMDGGTYEVPVVLNGVLKISFIFDSGASDISISPDVALTLIRTGTIKQSDFIGTQKYKFADGSTATSKVFMLHKIAIGNKEITNVKAAISANLTAPMLLGQSVLQRFGKFTIDNSAHTITLD